MSPRPTRTAPLSARSAALLQNLGAICAWSLAPPMIYSITAYFPVNFQNAVRYFVSLAVLWPVFLLTSDKSRLRGHFRLLRKKAPHIVLIALANYGFQVCYTYSLFLVTPSVMSLVSQTQMIFGVLFALILFHDERALIRRPLFLAGLVFALGGVSLVVAGSRTFGSPSLGVGVIVVLASAFCWALLGSLLRKWVPDVPPLLSICSVFSIVTPLFGATYMVMNRGFPIPAASFGQWFILLLSGLIAIGLGHSLFYRSVRVLGVAVSSTIGLLTPLLVSIISYIAYGEILTGIQILGAAALLGGCILIVRTRFDPRSCQPQTSIPRADRRW
jgi:drug/metabolite transporter (DMT)-like permease